MGTETAEKETTADEQLAAFAGLSSSIVSDAMDGLGLPSSVLDSSVRCFSGHSLIARARTVERRPKPSNAVQADFDPALGLGTQNVIDACDPGTAVVIASNGDSSTAMWGGNMGLRARACGVVGFVTDGAFRDSDEMEELGMTAKTLVDAYRSL